MNEINDEEQEKLTGFEEDRRLKWCGVAEIGKGGQCERETPIYGEDEER